MTDKIFNTILLVSFSLIIIIFLMGLIASGILLYNEFIGEKKMYCIKNSCKEETKHKHGFRVGDKVQYTYKYCSHFDNKYHEITSVLTIIEIRDNIICLDNGVMLHYTWIKHCIETYPQCHLKQEEAIIYYFTTGNIKEAIERMGKVSSLTAVRVIKQIKNCYPSELDRFLQLMDTASVSK